MISLGKSVNDVDIDKLYNLLKVCNNRVTIDTESVNIESMFDRSKHRQLLNSKVDDLNEQDKEFIEDMLKDKVFKLLKFILIKNDDLLRFKIKDENQWLSFAETIRKK